jgi:uncharacterized protein (DUF983 family)
MAWQCPACNNAVQYQDYKRVLAGATFSCHACGLELVRDKNGDKLVAAPPIAKPADKTARKRR